jgi:hypothetical protein
MLECVLPFHHFFKLPTTLCNEVIDFSVYWNLQVQVTSFVLKGELEQGFFHSSLECTYLTYKSDIWQLLEKYILNA